MPKQAHPDRSASTAPAREAFMRRFENEADPEEARRRYYAELGRKSGEARRRQAEAVADLLKRTRTDRGLALVIEDPALIAKVAAIVAAGGEAA